MIDNSHIFSPANVANMEARDRRLLAATNHVIVVITNPRWEPDLLTRVPMSYHGVVLYIMTAEHQFRLYVSHDVALPDKLRKDAYDDMARMGGEPGTLRAFYAIADWLESGPAGATPTGTSTQSLPDWRVLIAIVFSIIVLALIIRALSTRNKAHRRSRPDKPRGRLR